MITIATCNYTDYIATHAVIPAQPCMHACPTAKQFDHRGPIFIVIVRLLGGLYSVRAQSVASIHTCLHNVATYVTESSLL